MKCPPHAEDGSDGYYDNQDKVSVLFDALVSTRRPSNTFRSMVHPRVDSYLSPGFPIHSGSVMADCCRSVIRTPRLIVFLGGSPSLYTPAILAADLKKKKENLENSHDSNLFSLRCFSYQFSFPPTVT